MKKYLVSNDNISHAITFLKEGYATVTNDLFAYDDVWTAKTGSTLCNLTQANRLSNSLLQEAERMREDEKALEAKIIALQNRLQELTAKAKRTEEAYEASVSLAKYIEGMEEPQDDVYEQ